MRKINTALLSALLFAWLLGGSWWYANTYRSIEPNSKNAFKVSLDSLQFTAATNFFFPKSSSEISIPKLTEIALEQIASYLRQHPTHSLSLTGIYQATEINDSQLDNLGQARAESLRDVLIDYGVNPPQINTQSLRVHQVVLQENHLIGGVYFEFSKGKSARSLTPLLGDVEAKNTIKIEKLNLYFPKDKYKLKMTPELEAYFDKLKQYLAYEKDAQIIITGFTDNQGKPANNLRLSKYRAKKVKSFMMKYGFPSNQLTVDFKGEAKPIASNDNETGREKNRRVELRIKE
ncbi:MAG: OmpA family protein [Saprospiraceae bacterium]